MIHSCSSWQIGWKEHFLSCFALAAVIPAQHHSSPGPVWSACSGRGWGWRPWPQGMIWVCTAPCCPLVVVFRAAPCLHRTFSVLCWQKGTKINYRNSSNKKTTWRLQGGNTGGLCTAPAVLFAPVPLNTNTTQVTNSMCIYTNEKLSILIRPWSSWKWFRGSERGSV